MITEIPDIRRGPNQFISYFYINNMWVAAWG
jgi:hypothetical protein